MDIRADFEIVPDAENRCKKCSSPMREKEVHWMWDGSVGRHMPMPPEWVCSACDKAGAKAC